MDDGLRVEQRGEAIYKEAKQVSWAHGHGHAQPNPRADSHDLPSHGPHSVRHNSEPNRAQYYYRS